MTDIQKKKKFERAHRVLEIAKRMAKDIDAKHGGYQVQNRIEGMKIHPGYANSNEENELVITGDWNKIDEYDRDRHERVVITDLPERLGLIFEKIGFETEWDDCWRECDDCYKLIETNPSHAWWKPQYVEQGSETICKKCFLENPDATLANLDVSRECLDIAFEFDPTQHGYTKYKEVNANFLHVPEVQELVDEVKGMGLRGCFVQHVRGERNESLFIVWVDSDSYNEYLEEQAAPDSAEGEAVEA